MPSLNGQISSGLGRKNLLINGNFDIWQRVGNVSASVTSTLIIGDNAFIAYIDSNSDSGLIVNWTADAEL